MTAEDIYELSKLAILEYLTSGITGVFDMYLTPDSIADAFDEMGMRCVQVGGVNNFSQSVEMLEEIIARDASLSYALLKMANSAYFAVHHETTSIRQALVRVGISQLKQWVYLLSFEDKGENSSEELLKTSFLRANFASALVKKLRKFEITASDAYLMGMFSTLEYMIDAPIEEILFEIPIIKEVKDALIYQEGMAGKLYQLIHPL